MILENYIADSIDESMKDYINSKEYRDERRKISEKTAAFRAALSLEMKIEFNILMNDIDNFDSAFASKAYVTGTVNGIALREKIK